MGMSKCKMAITCKSYDYMKQTTRPCQGQSLCFLYCFTCFTGGISALLCMFK